MALQCPVYSLVGFGLKLTSLRLWQHAILSASFFRTYVVDYY